MEDRNFVDEKLEEVLELAKRIEYLTQNNSSELGKAAKI